MLIYINVLKNKFQAVNAGVEHAEEVEAEKNWSANSSGAVAGGNTCHGVFYGFFGLVAVRQRGRVPGQGALS
jgi:hypothetical protein